MRRSQAPSTKRPRLDDADGAAAQAWNIAQARPATGIALGGHLGLTTSSICCGVTGPQQSGPASSGPSSGGKHNKPLRPPLGGHGLNTNKQFKCPVPGASGVSCRQGSLGLKKNYSNITGDLLRSIQRTVILKDDLGAADAASAVSELVLYDPAEHRLQLQQAHLEQHNASSSQPPTQAAMEVTTPELRIASHASAKSAGTGTLHDIEAADASHAHTNAAIATDKQAGQQQQARGSLLMPQKELASSAAPPLQADTHIQPVSQEPLAAQQEQHLQQQYDLQFGINWSQRVKVHADLFLVEKLRPHQREGLKFVFECLCGVRQEGIFGAVLADGMGLGKTFQTIASLYSLMTKGVTGAPTCKKPLILCPTSLVQNWGKELRHWLGERVTPVVVDDTRADCVKKSFQSFRAYSPPGKAPKVLVMSYPCFRMHKTEVYKMGIDVMMCDEAHFLKNGEAQITQAVSGLSAKRRLLMSGTPIQNDLSEFHAVFDLACPGLLGDIKAFNKTYEGPIQRGRDADATDKQAALGLERMAELMKLCNKFMLRRTSTVLKALLPAKVEQVVFCKLSPLQLKLYNAFLSSQPVQALLASTAADETTERPAGGGPKKRKSAKTAAKSAAAAADDKENMAPGAAPSAGTEGQQQQQPEAKAEPLAPLVAITALKKLCCHPDLIWEMLNKHKVQEKQQQQQQQLAEMLNAQRRMSGRAAAAGTRNYASMVDDADSDDEGKGHKKGGSKRKNNSSNNKGGGGRLTGFEGTEPLFTHGDVYPAYQPSKCQAFHSGKVMVLESLLKAIRASEPTDKVVLVSNYTEALDILGGMCTAQRWMSLRLDGSCSVKQRQAIVDTFNDPQHPSFVLLLSSKAGGVGLNIIGANRLVLFDPDWNPANDLQAMARVWREGQKKRVWIYRMLMAGSIEEKVLQRQLAKQGLSEALVDEVGQEVRTFSRDELRSLFRVNPAVACETHSAIKCSCDGSLQAMESCKERAAAASSSREAEKQGVMAWAHLTKAANSPDPTWQAMTSFVRDNYVTFVFSDHVLDEAQPADAPQPAAGVAGSTSSRGAQQRDKAGGEDAAGGDDASQEDERSSEGGGDSDSCSDEKAPAAVVMPAARYRGASKQTAATVAVRPPLARRTSAGPATGAAAPTRPVSRLRRKSAPAAAETTAAASAAKCLESQGNHRHRGVSALPAPTAAVVRATEGVNHVGTAATSPISDSAEDEENLPAMHDFGCDDDDPDGWFQ